MKTLATLFKSASRARRRRLRIDISDRVVYAIGDVHGCLDKLRSLEAKVAADARSFGGRKLIVMLGDYVDRGPASAEVIAHLAGPPPEGFDRICLAGNHETLMLDYLDGRCELAEWLAVGGAATLASYGIDRERAARHENADAIIRAAIPRDHVDFLRSLPVLIETTDFVFVHAGFHPDMPLERQDDETLTTIRGAFQAKAHLLARTVVHGHTPVAVPRLDGRLLNIDTGACFGRRLTAVRIFRGKGRLFQS